MSQPEWWEEQHAQIRRRDRRRRRQNQVAALLALVALAGGGYYLLRQNTNNKGCGPAPSGTDLQGILEANAYYDCVVQVARSRPPITVFQGTLTASATAVANAYMRAEWVRKDCGTPTALFNAIRPGYSPECGSFNLVGGEDLSDAYLVSGSPRLQHHCSNNNYYRVRASQCLVYRFIAHTNKLRGAWEYVVIRQTLWLRPVHGRWRVILETDEGDRRVLVGEPGTKAARHLWANRLKPTRA